MSDTCPVTFPKISFSTVMSELNITEGVNVIDELSGLSISVVNTRPVMSPVTSPTTLDFSVLLKFQVSSDAV